MNTASRERKRQWWGPECPGHCSRARPPPLPLLLSLQLLLLLLLLLLLPLMLMPLMLMPLLPQLLLLLLQPQSQRKLLSAADAEAVAAAALLSAGRRHYRVQRFKQQHEFTSRQHSEPSAASPHLLIWTESRNARIRARSLSQLTPKSNFCPCTWTCAAAPDSPACCRASVCAPLSATPS